jgi:hypothetical protein
MSQTAFPPELLTQSTANRLAYFRACTIAHPRLQEADQSLHNAISEPIGELLVFFYGPTGVGKTTVLGRRRQQIIEERRTEMERDPGWIPIVGMEAMSPERGDFNWRDYYIDALRAFDEPLINRKVSNPETVAGGPNASQYIPRRIDGRSILRAALESAIRQRRPIAFLVDEAQHLAKISGGRKLQDQLDCLKSLAIRTNTVHVLAGTYELLILRQLSGQLSRRTRQIHFARYRAETANDARDFKNVLWNFQIRMPLKSEPDLMSHWEFCYERSLGCIGLLKDWLSRALADGLSQKKPNVTIRHLEKQALSIADCQKIASEILEGEAILADSESARKRLRFMLGLEEEKAPARALSSKAMPETNPAQSRQTKYVGERNPKRDPVGLAKGNEGEGEK